MTSPARRRFTLLTFFRLQQLMRGDEGYLLALAYSTQRGYGRNHPLRGRDPQRLYRRMDSAGRAGICGGNVSVGELLMTQCEMVNGFIDPPDEPPHFTRGYGLVFGMSERKAMAMALVDRALQAPEYGEHATGPAQDGRVRAGACRQRRSRRLCLAPQTPALRQFQAKVDYFKTYRTGAKTMANLSGYNFAYLNSENETHDPPRHLKSGGYPRLSGAVWRARGFMPYGWGTGGIQLTASVIGESDVLEGD